MNDETIEVIPGLNAPEEPEQTPEAPEAEQRAEAPEVKEEKPAEKYVPLSALHEERMRRKEQSEQIRELNERYNQLLENLKPPPEPLPDLNENPVAHFDARLKAQEEAIQKHRESIQQEERVKQAAEQNNQFLMAYHQSAQQFSESHKDFPQAYQALITGRVNELKAGGVDAATAKMMAESEEQFIVSQAFQQGGNPAERIYALAKARGYKSENSGAKLETIEKGQQAKSLAGAGSTPKEPDSLEAIAEIDDDQEFLKAFKRLAG